MIFADRLQTSILRRGSVLIAGLDPLVEKLPGFILKAASAESTNEESAYRAITDYYHIALRALASSVAAVKPNLAFFEQYGIAGIRAFHSVCAMARDLELPVVADGKRGDIGSTAEAYARAYLGKVTIDANRTIEPFAVDALTVNPFLGFDTLEPFIEQCVANGKGMYVLVRTSNPGSSALQAAISAGGIKASDQIAEVVASYAERCLGECGLSSIGAVVGATYPEELSRLRGILKRNLLLVPGVGAQGGSVQDSKAAFLAPVNPLPSSPRPPPPRGALINLSRGLFNSPEEIFNASQLSTGLAQRAAHWNQQIEALTDVGID